MVASSYLLGLFFQASDEGLDCLIVPGYCLGILLLIIAFLEFPDFLTDIKNRKIQNRGWRRYHEGFYYCHICGNPSPGPSEHWEQDSDGKGQFYGEFLVTNWDKPTELARCSLCHKWACTAHIVNGVCQACAKNLL
jgi:hypothetical protein